MLTTNLVGGTAVPKILCSELEWRLYTKRPYMVNITVSKEASVSRTIQDFFRDITRWCRRILPTFPKHCSLPCQGWYRHHWHVITTRIRSTMNTAPDKGFRNVEEIYTHRVVISPKSSWITVSSTRLIIASILHLYFLDPRDQYNS
jgi:hypothetical protein